MRISIDNARVIDPFSEMDEIKNLQIANGLVTDGLCSPGEFKADRVIDATGLVVCPGLVDISVRLGESAKSSPSSLEKELMAVVAGGVTTVGCPPDIHPVLDEPGLVSMLRDRARAVNLAKIYPIGALTRSLLGEHLTDMVALSESGCFAFSQGDGNFPSPLVLRRAMEYASTFGLNVWLRPQENSLSEGGVAHEGEVATRLGLPGIPSIAEAIAVSTVILIAQETKARVHLCRLSSEIAINLVRNAKDEGVNVTSDISLNNLHLSEVDIGFFDTNHRFVPPLRGTRDRKALRSGLLDNSVDIICSDHTPVSGDDKNIPFGEAAPGACGVEMLLPLVLRWAKQEGIPLKHALKKVTCNPSDLLVGTPKRITGGEVADLCIFDPEMPCLVDENSLVSKTKNTPFINTELIGVNMFTIVGGEILFERLQTN